ncbi:histidine kinase [Trinickia dabaoshanensis]|uniref:Histidine kinase n=1 Tax=Trinickia dabaoshanensis TaxID=564714 RepID=A0A2N7VDE9_9BURK|nr:histidine kinase [Trinickia dabaoshanensis]PMS15144.1 histidine kinase [Trinickia dabaoshanensis]
MHSEQHTPITSNGTDSRLRPGAGARPDAPVLGNRASIVWVVVFSCIVGLGFWAAHRSQPLLPNLVVGITIGLAAALFSTLLNRFGSPRLGPVLKVLLIAPASVVVGVEFTAATIGGMPHLIGHTDMGAWLNYGTSFVVTGVACAFFTVSAQAMRMRATLETQRREAAELRQSETAARLALLQAQIEPHFLFNTLANVQSLIERDPKRAASMLGSLNRYLRASLTRTRSTASTLADELELVEALLNIAAIRLGERLRFTIDVPEPLRALPLAPLLLQPLVENALLHGIEPSIEGGDIRVVGRREGDMLVLEAIDTGVGLGHTAKLHGGVGLANVRARLASMYGARAGVSVMANAGAARGVTARLSIPVC